MWKPAIVNKKMSGENKKNILLSLKPTTVIVLSFFFLIVVGTFLLCLPAASRSGTGTSLLTALFTATSAVCVTGLVVVDTYSHWSLFGQIVILSLIQAGGLGIITLTTFFAAMLGRKMRLRNMILAQESINLFSFQGIAMLVKTIVIVTLSIEAAGALILSARFVPQYGPAGFYLGIFHSISAFCNAGFDLMSISGKGKYLSFTAYNNDPVVIYTIALLIILGGLGFVVWKDMYDFRKTHALSLHTKLVLVITALLIITGTVLFYFFESDNPATMGKLNITGKINAAVFQAITPRTAGFNTIDIGGMNEISKLLTVILMFIGAAPGSTAGGIKVTTFGVLLFAVISEIKGMDETTAFRRRISYNTVTKALAIFGLSVSLVLVITTLMLVIEGKPMLNILFEATSAFGTVGLTTGLTPDLHAFSKILLIITMFLGRVGPFTFAIGLTIKSHRTTTDLVYPEGRVIVG